MAQRSTEVSKVTVTKSENKKIRLHTQPGTPITVALIDAEGTLLYQGNVNNKDARGTSFNLATLPDGQYFLTATNDTFWLSQGLTIRGTTLTIDTQHVRQLARPTLTAYEKNKFQVTIPESNVPAPAVNVTIYDRQHELVYADRLTNRRGRFDLSTLPVGDYTFMVGSDQKQFAQLIQIQK